MRKIIRQFDGTKYDFLSNFHPSCIYYNNMKYQNAEAAFQGQKPEDLREREFYQNLLPSEAKSYGRRCKLRKDWENVKDQIMYDVVTAKFSQNYHLKQLLLETKNAELIE